MLIRFIKSNGIITSFSVILLIDFIMIVYFFNQSYIAEELMARVLPLSVISAGLSIAISIIAASHMFTDSKH